MAMNLISKQLVEFGGSWNEIADEFNYSLVKPLALSQHCQIIVVIRTLMNIINYCFYGYIYLLIKLTYVAEQQVGLQMVKQYANNT